jgi:signal transduction histidine kinase
MDAALAVPAALAGPGKGRTARVAGCGLLALALASVAIAAAVAASSAAGHPALVALGRAVIVGVPIGVGLYSWYARPDPRFGVALAVTGGACALTALAESHDQTLYTIGRAAGWLVEVFIVYLILCFPTGRLASRTDRILAAAIGLVVLGLFVPRLLLAEFFETPSPYTTCVHGCPDNALFILRAEPSFVGEIMRPAGALAVCLVMAAVILRLRHRLTRATPLTRRVLIPVLAVGVARLVLLAVGITARSLDPTLPALRVVAWLLALAVPAMALAFLFGLVTWQVFGGRALQRLASSLGAIPDAMALRKVLGETWGDPTLRIAFPAPGATGAWLDIQGRPLGMPPAGGGRVVTNVHRGGLVIARIIHDEALSADPALLHAGVAIAGIALDNQRLVVQFEAAMREVRQSRARIAASAAQERRRIERDLHDGAQQRLVALRIELALAEDLVRRDLERGVAQLHELGQSVEDALEDLRSLGHGIYPSLLADRGLIDALRSVATHSTVPIEFDVRGVRRYPPELEGAVYFSVLEALQNVLKHAQGAHRIVLSLDGRAQTVLHFSIDDDGAGAHAGTVAPGAGITNMHDRLAAIGGEITVTSTPRVGTVVRGRVPTPARGPQPGR